MRELEQWISEDMLLFLGHELIITPERWTPKSPLLRSECRRST